MLKPSHTNIVNTKLKSKNKRLSKSQKNKIKVRNKITHNLENERKELQMIKYNLRQIGVAQKLVHNLTGKLILEGALNCLALGTKFIPVSKVKLEIILESMPKFRKIIRLRHIFQNEENNNIIPQYWIPLEWKPPFLDQRRDIESTLTLLQQLIIPNTTLIKSNINKRDIQQYNNLLYNKNILVILADKNLEYAIVIKLWYIDRCFDHLNFLLYIKVTEDYSKGIQGKTVIQHLVDSLNDLVMEYKYQLGLNEIKWILQKPKIQWELMRFYITAKVYKKLIKGRPIVLSMTQMTFHLS